MEKLYNIGYISTCLFCHSYNHRIHHLLTPSFPARISVSPLYKTTPRGFVYRLRPTGDEVVNMIPTPVYTVYVCFTRTLAPTNLHSAQSPNKLRPHAMQVINVHLPWVRLAKAQPIWKHQLVDPHSYIPIKLYQNYLAFQNWLVKIVGNFLFEENH